jgi:hypothetical protein
LESGKNRTYDDMFTSRNGKNCPPKKEIAETQRTGHHQTTNDLFTRPLVIAKTLL